MADKETGLVEKLLLDVGLEERGGNSWLNWARTVDTAGSAVLDIVENHDKLGKVMQPLMASAERSFFNLSSLAEKLANRVKNVTSDFSAWNLATQSAGAASDILGFKMDELGNMFTRWKEIVTSGSLPTLITLVGGFKLITGAVTLALDTWYKLGQAMADQVKAQQHMAESMARLTGQATNLIHRLGKLTEIRIFREAGRDLGEAGKAMESFSRATSMATTMVELGLVKFGSLVVKFDQVTQFLASMRAQLDLFTAAMADFASTSARETFSAKVFLNAGEALRVASENMAAWSAETGIAESEIMAMLERMGRGMGDVATSYSLATLALEKSFQMQHVNARELLGLVEGISRGAKLSTETLRVFGAELETNSKRYADAGLRLRLVVDQMMAGSDVLDREDMFKTLTENASIAYSLMEQTLANYTEAQIALDKKAWTEYERLAGLKTTSFEEEIQYRQIVSQFTAKQISDEQRVIAGLEAQLALRRQFGGTSLVEDYAPQIAQLQSAMARAAELRKQGVTAEAQEAFTQTRQMAADMVQGLRDATEEAFRYIAQRAESLAQLQLRIVAPDAEARVEAISKSLGEARAAEFAATKRVLDLQTARLTDLQASDAQRLQAAAKLVETYSQAYSRAAELFDEYQSTATEARRTIIDIYATEGSLMRANFQTRMNLMDQELRRSKQLADINAVSGQQQMAALRDQASILTRQLQMARELRAATAGSVERAKTDPATLARQTAFGSNFASVMKEAMTGVLSVYSQKQLANFSQGKQQAIDTALSIASAQRAASMIGELEKITERSNTFGEFVSRITTRYRDEGHQSDALRIAEERGMTQKFTDRAGVEALKIKDPRTELRDIADQLAKLESAAAARAAQSAREISELQTRNTEVVGAVQAITSKQGELGEVLKTLLDNLIADLNEVFSKQFSPQIKVFNDLVKEDLRLQNEGFASSTSLFAKAAKSIGDTLRGTGAVNNAEMLPEDQAMQIQNYVAQQVADYRAAAADGDAARANAAMQNLQPEAVAKALGMSRSPEFLKTLGDSLQQIMTQNETLLRALKEGDATSEEAMRQIQGLYQLRKSSPLATVFPFLGEVDDDPTLNDVGHASRRARRAGRIAEVQNNQIEQILSAIYGESKEFRADPQMEENNRKLEQANALLSVIASKIEPNSGKAVARELKDRANKQNASPPGTPTVLSRQGGMTPSTNK